MALFSFLRGLFGGPAPAQLGTPAPPQAQPAAPHADTWDADEPPWWLPRGTPVLTPPSLSPDHQLVDRVLYDECVRALDDPNLELPHLPQVAQQLLLMLHGDDADLRQAADVAARDPALASLVLRRANSVAYHRGVEVRALDAAFVRLGRRAVRGLVLASSLKDVAIRTGGAQRTLGEELWRRSLASAVIVSRLAPRCGLDPDDGFLLGLLHDLGMLGLLKIAHSFQQQGRGRVTRATYDTLAERWHEHLGLRLALAWNLPEPLPEIIGSHHRRPDADDALAQQRHAVQIADAASALLEYAPYVPYDFFNLPAALALNLTDEPATHAELADWPDLIAERMEPTA